MQSVVAGAISVSTSAPGYSDSVDSSPRSLGTDPKDESFPSSAAAASSRLRLMVSYGGRIVPRPTNMSFCYLGGETHMVVVDRPSTLSVFSAKLSRKLLGSRPFLLKYQLPNEDLNSLISITTDEDLEDMIDELDRISAGSAANLGRDGGSNRSSRLRLFLFPSKSESSPLTGKKGALPPLGAHDQQKNTYLHRAAASVPHLCPSSPAAQPLQPSSLLPSALTVAA